MRIGLLLLAAILSARPLTAQSETYWVVPTTVGFGGLGCAGGYALASELRESAGWSGTVGPSVFLGTLGGCLIGWAIGWKAGKQADALLSDGQELPTGLRRGVQLGTVLAGATLATLVSFVHLGFQDGRDAEIMAAYALAGAVGGVVFLLAQNHRLYPEKSSPTLELGRGLEGGVSVGVRLRF